MSEVRGVRMSVYIMIIIITTMNMTMLNIILHNLKNNIIIN